MLRLAVTCPREFDVNDLRIEDVNEVLVLVDVLVEARNVEFSQSTVIFRELLQRKQVLEDDTARLEKHVSEAFLTVSRLKHAKAA